MFAAVGPPVGGLVVGLALAAMVGFERGFTLSLLSSLPTTALLGYAYGVLPAVATGWAASSASPFLGNDRVWLVVSAALGALLSSISLWFIVIGGTLAGSLGVLGAGCMAGLVGGICSLAVRPAPR